MTLLTAHRILISTAIVFFLGMALWEIRNYFTTENSWAPVRALIYLLVSVGFALYLKRLRNWLK